MTRASSRSLLATAAVVVLAAVAPGSPVAPDAHAGTIQRCAAPDGTTLYTDKPCAAFDAAPLGMPGDLAARLIDASQAEAEANGGHATGAAHVDASALARAGGSPAYGRRSAAAGCARSPTQLAMDLQGAFALGDVNRIAESWHWVGMDHAAAMPVMQRLERLAMSTVTDTRYFDASFGTGPGLYADAGQAATAGGGGGIMQLTLGGEGGHQVLDLRVDAYDGCWFVRF